MNHWLDSGPIIVGGVGGSGTRAIAAIFRELGYYMGSDLNESLDNLWFTLLFKRPRWFYQSKNLKLEILHELALFEKIMNSKSKLTIQDYKSLCLALTEMSFYGHDHLGSGRGLWPTKRLISILHRNRDRNDNYLGWGWKEPNTHLFIEDLNEYFDNCKYILVIRHGLDMAYSSNQAQLYNWGKFFGVEIPKKSTDIPPAYLDYWIKANKRAIMLGNNILRDRFLVINFDQLFLNFQNELGKILSFIKYDRNEAKLLNNLSNFIRRPESLGRYKKYDLSCFPESSLREVQELGFQIDKKIY